MIVWLLLDATGYPIDAYAAEADAKAECDRRNYHNNGLRVLRVSVHRERSAADQQVQSGLV